MSEAPVRSGLRLWFRRLRTLLWTALSIVTLLAAVAVGVGKLLMPYSAQYKPRLEAWLAREFNQPVRVDSFVGEWKAFGPRITLEGLNLLGRPGDDSAIALRRAALDVKPLNALLPGRPLYSFRIIGADLALTRSADGRFELSGLGVNRRNPGAGADGNAGLAALSGVGELRLEQSTLSLHDQASGIGLRLAAMDGRLQLAQDRLALELQASITELDSERILGDLGATVILALDGERRPAEVRWHLKSGELLVAELARPFPEHELKPVAGRLNAELWGSWSPGAAQRMEGVLDIRDAAMGPAGGPVQVQRLNSRFRWRMSGRRSWRLDLADLRIEEHGRAWDSPRVSVERHIAGGLGVWVSADRLRVDFPLALSRLIVAGTKGRWPRGAPTAGTGQVTDFDLVINADKKLAAARGEATGVAITEWDRWPALDGLSGSVDLLYGQGVARFGGDAVRVDWPRNFRAPAVLEIPDCEMEILWGERYQVDARRCVLRNEQLELTASTRFVGNAGKPFVDINVAAPRLALSELQDYWPESVIKPKVSAWLRRAIRAGTARNARFSLVGDMDEFPFDAGQGRLEASFDFTGGRLAYQPGWPEALDVEARAHFIDSGMTLEGSIGRMGSAPVRQVRARIDDFQEPRLLLDWDTSARLPELATFLGATPLLRQGRLDITRFAVEGPARLGGRLSLPLGSASGELALDGLLRLDGNGFLDQVSGFSLEGLSGELAFDAEGFRGTALEAAYLGRPVGLDVAADWDAPEPFQARMNGRHPIEELALGLAPRPLPLLDAVRGSVAWQAELKVMESDGEPAMTLLTVDSDLVGLTSDLPRPLTKAAEEAWPMTLRFPLTGEERLVEVRFPERMELRLELTAAPDGGPGEDGPGAVNRAVLQLGAEPAMLPPPGFFSLHGQAPRVDLDGWLRTAAESLDEMDMPGGLQLSEAELETGELLFLNRVFGDVRMSLDQREDSLEAFFAAQDLDGTVRFLRAPTGERSLIAEFERLALEKPLDSGVSMEANPAELPEMHFYVRELEYLGLRLGETSLEAYPIGDGLRIDSLRAVSDQVTLEARGDWTGDEQESRSDFDIVMTSESLGALIDALELSSVLEGGQTMVRYNAWWPGPPAAFELAQLNGEMSFSVVGGRVLNADPGAGRVLGLLSVGALPRRLAFDFDDVFDSGFSFDRAQGTLRLESGTAHTDDFLLESTAATLAIQGSSDLVNQQFDYRMSVRPGVSQALPVIGAIAAGPPGAAAGLALQGLLREALGDAAEARYSITGSWTDPVVERLEAPPAPTPPAPLPVEGELAGASGQSGPGESDEP